MSDDGHMAPDDIRTLFSRAMSRMYQVEVPQYDTLLALVADINARTLAADPALEARLAANRQHDRLNEERHGAIRLGAPAELSTMRRLFAVMGMAPVGYYDLAAAGVPVHSTAFRPVGEAALTRNPFRVFTSLLRLDLIADEALRTEAAEILSRRRIFTDDCVTLIEAAERHGGLTAPEAERFVAAALETFRWHSEATVSAEVYRRLRQAHTLVADVVCFRGPHINHLTPRTLDIDAAQVAMAERGLSPKAVIEGPPGRRVPILLRQTSFKALAEPVVFAGSEAGAHTARFGEIEQRGAALTPKGRDLYDRLLAAAQAQVKVAPDGANAPDYMAALSRHFEGFPDDEDALRREGLAYVRYAATGKRAAVVTDDVEALISAGAIRAEPLIYEDFLPVSAAGIFQSNLGDEQREEFGGGASQAAFEAALGVPVLDPDALYREMEDASKRAALSALRS